MNNKYNSVFESIYTYVKGSTMAAWVFVLAVITLMIGVNGFVEDTYSSYVGIQMIEETFNVRPASWELTYWLMSLSFQVVSVITFFAYLSDKKGNWWGLWLAIGSQMVDFIADVWYRSNGTYNSPVQIMVSLAFTFLFFTIGSEVALTFGLGLVARMFVEGMSQLAILTRNIIAGFVQLMQILASGVPGEKGATDSSVTHVTKDQKFQHQNNGNQPPGVPPTIEVQNVRVPAGGPPPPVNPGNNHNQGGGNPSRPPFQPPHPPNPPKK